MFPRLRNIGGSDVTTESSSYGVNQEDGAFKDSALYDAIITSLNELYLDTSATENNATSNTASNRPSGKPYSQQAPESKSNDAHQYNEIRNMKGPDSDYYWSEPDYFHASKNKLDSEISDVR